jgi:hypothetical protein
VSTFREALGKICWRGLKGVVLRHHRLLEAADFDTRWRSRRNRRSRQARAARILASPPFRKNAKGWATYILGVTPDLQV